MLQVVAAAVLLLLLLLLACACRQHRHQQDHLHLHPHHHQLKLQQHQQHQQGRLGAGLLETSVQGQPCQAAAALTKSCHSSKPFHSGHLTQVYHQHQQQRQQRQVLQVRAMFRPGTAPLLSQQLGLALPAEAATHAAMLAAALRVLVTLLATQQQSACRI
jgi:hypothetical protein